MRSAPARWGILGTGKAARNLSAAIRATIGGELQAIASRGEQGLAAAESLGAPRCYASYAALARSDEVDVVHIATPHTTHYENAMLCLEAGKHVVCEKPLTLSRSEAEALKLAAQAKRLFLMEAVWTRFLPAVVRSGELVRRGSLGTPQLVTTSVALRFDPAADARIFDPSLGGGALSEFGTYPLAFAVGYVGPVISCKALATHRGPVVGQVLFQCIHAHGLSSGFCALDFQGRNHVTVAGSEGQSTLLPASGRFERMSIWNRSTGKETLEDHPYEGTGYEFMVEHVNDCLRNGLTESPSMPLSDSINMAQALETCIAQVEPARRA